jgi:hypothetical protein
MSMKHYQTIREDGYDGKDCHIQIRECLAGESEWELISLLQVKIRLQLSNFAKYTHCK